MSLDRNQSLRKYFELQIPLLRVHYPKEFYDDIVICSCQQGMECTAIGKHPVDDGGVNGAKERRSAAIFRNFNVGVACGHGFVVLDIDPRNGGEETLAALEQQHGKLPATWKVITGGDGEHYYFRVSGSHCSGNRLAKKGFELKGVGSYVLAPTSLHRSGKYYDWEVEPDECEMAELPAWVAEVAMPHPTTHKAHDVCDVEEYDRVELLDALNALDPSMPYPDWFKVGAACHAAGLTFEDFNAWSARCSEKYSEKACAAQWSRYSQRVGGVGARTLFALAYDAGWEPKILQVERWDLHASKHVEVDDDVQVTEQLDVTFPPGIAGELCEEILDAATYKQRRLAIVSTIAMLSTCIQGTYRSPNGNGVLGSYQIIVTEAGDGKGDFVKPVSRFMRDIFKELILGEPASPQALRAEMYRCPSRIVTLDEAMKWLSKTMLAKDSNAQGLQADFLTAWGGGTLEAISTKDSANSSPEILEPTLSVIGAGQTEVFRSLLKQGRALAQDGFLSRIDIIVATSEEPETFLMKPKTDLSIKLLNRLKNIANRCRKIKEVKVPTSKDRSGEMIERVVYDLKIASWGDGAAQAWNDFARECYRNKRARLPFVWARTAEKALRCATLLAVLEDPNSPTVSGEQIEWAARWFRHLSVELENECHVHLDKSDEQLASEAILHAIKRAGGRVLRSQVGAWSREWKKLDERIKMAAIDSLAREGKIQVISLRGKAMAFELVKK